MTNHYKVRSPTRVDLAGGTLDLWPLYNFFGGAQTVNMAIDIYTTAELEINKENTSIEFESLDLKKKKYYLSYQKAIEDTDPDFSLFRIVTDYFKPSFGFKVKTSSESPVGGGLGGSSSLLISLLKVFSQATLQNFSNTHQMVQVAHNLEAQLLMTPTGTQDYYPAASGGINILDYSAQGIKQNLYEHKNIQEIERRFLLVYTGRSHHSGMNNFEVLQKAVAKDGSTIRALSQIKLVAEEMAGKVRAGLWDQLGELFRREYASRIQLAPAVLSPEIEALEKLTLASGAEAIKICGAGGGGCVLVWCHLGQKEQVRNACQSAGFQTLPAIPLPSLA